MRTRRFGLQQFGLVAVLAVSLAVAVAAGSFALWGGGVMGLGPANWPVNFRASRDGRGCTLDLWVQRNVTRSFQAMATNVAVYNWVATLPQPAKSQFAGLLVYRDRADLSTSTITGGSGLQVRWGIRFGARVSFKWLICAAAFTAALAAWRLVVMDQRRVSVPGCCRRCGYDLRATPDRCPECGAIEVEP